MNTKLTLRMDERSVRKAKSEARKRHMSVSGMVSTFFDLLVSQPLDKNSLPPVTRSLIGVLKGRDLSEADFRRHLREKHS